MKRPAFQWYPGDWRRDTALESCSIEARGLWIEMLNIMHDGEPYGHLTAGGVPIDAAALGNLTGIPPAKLSRILKELEDRKIFSRTAEGLIYSRRMVRDEAVRNKRAAGGKLGGNPALLGLKDKDDGPSDDTEVQRKDNHDSTPATATATTAAAVASAVEPELQAAAYARECAKRANQGLAEHPKRPQKAAKIGPTAASTVEAAEVMRNAGVPHAFAESEIYRLAKSHSAEDAITSLKYFTAGVLRAWKRKQAKDDASGADRPPANAPGSSNGANGTATWSSVPSGNDPTLRALDEVGERWKREAAEQSHA